MSRNSFASSRWSNTLNRLSWHPVCLCHILFGNVDISSFFQIRLCLLATKQARHRAGPLRDSSATCNSFCYSACTAIANSQHHGSVCGHKRAHCRHRAAFPEPHSHPVQCGTHCSCTTHTCWFSTKACGKMKVIFLKVLTKDNCILQGVQLNSVKYMSRKSHCPKHNYWATFLSFY